MCVILKLIERQYWFLILGSLLILVANWIGLVLVGRRFDVVWRVVIIFRAKEHFSLALGALRVFERLRFLDIEQVCCLGWFP